MKYLSLIAALGFLAAPAHAERTLYSDATVIDGTGSPARPHTDILVDSDRIVAVGPHGTLGDGAKRVDLAGRFVIPGIIDSHVHLATPPDRAKAEVTLRRELYSGVTGVRDMADDIRAVAELARASEQGEIPAPDIAFPALMAGLQFFADPRIAAASKGWKAGTAPWMQSIDDKTDLPLAIARAKGTGAAAIKIYADLPPRLVAAITAEAHKQGMLAWAHSSVFPTRPADVIAAGVDTVSHVCYLAYQTAPVMLANYEDHTPVHENLLHFPDDPVMATLFRDMLKQRTILDATGGLFVRADAARAADPKARQLRCTGPATTALTRQAWKMGVPISTGTDFDEPSKSAWPAVFAELYFLAHDVGMSPLEVLHAATLNGARGDGGATRMSAASRPGSSPTSLYSRAIRYPTSPISRASSLR